MLNAQKISSLYKSAYVREIQPMPRLDKYDASADRNREQSPSKNFKSILEKELSRADQKSNQLKK